MKVLQTAIIKIALRCARGWNGTATESADWWMDDGETAAENARKKDVARTEAQQKICQRLHAQHETECRCRSRTLIGAQD